MLHTQNLFYETLNLSLIQSEDNQNVCRLQLKGELGRAEITSARVAAARRALQDLNGEAGLILSDNYESAITLDSFIRAGGGFKVYALGFLQSPKTEKSGIQKLCEKFNIEYRELIFDFNNEDNYNELWKLQEAAKPLRMEELFELWASCQFDESAILPGQFVIPAYGSAGTFQEWVLPGLKDLCTYNFFSNFNSIPSFLACSLDLIGAQMDFHIHNCTEWLARHEKRQVLSRDPRCRRMVAECYGAEILEDFAEPVLKESVHYAALKNCERRILENYLVMQRTCERSWVGSYEQFNIGHSFHFVDFRPEGDLYQKLFSISQKTELTGAAIAVPVAENAYAAYAVFPELLTLHRYKGELKTVESFVAGLKYMVNHNNFISRTDLHLMPELSSLVEFFRQSVKDNFSAKYLTYDDFEITQCWANKATYMGTHHTHTHPNSFLGGVFYLTDEITGGTIFPKEKRELLHAKSFYPSVWTGSGINCNAERGKLLLFPAYMSHGALPNESKTQIRYTVSFNVVLRGNLGFHPDVSWLKL